MIICKLGRDIYLDQEYIEIIKPLLRDENVQEMRKYISHGYVDCLTHSLYVSYMAYRLGKKMGLNYKGMARAGLLHDLYLYDWHHKNDREGLHGFTHADIALKNARKVTRLKKGEADIIKTHMWPLNPRLPKYFESVIFMFADRYCTLMEVLRITPILPRVFE